MTESRRIAGLVGPTIVAMVASEFPRLQPHLYDAQIPPVVYLSGVLMFVGGLAGTRKPQSPQSSVQQDRQCPSSSSSLRSLYRRLRTAAIWQSFLQSDRQVLAVYCRTKFSCRYHPVASIPNSNYRGGAGGSFLHLMS